MRNHPPYRVPDKYNFDNELKEAKEITSFRIDSWDPRSAVIDT
jgi:hypothetical protein